METSKLYEMKNTGWKKIAGTLFKALFCIVIICVLAVAGYAAYIAATAERIDPESLYSHIERSSYLYDDSGNEIDKLYYTEDRKIAEIDRIPADTKNAFIAIEDKTFYKHHGFNFRRMIGAVIDRILGRSDVISGTSTITQQLARNVYLNDIKSQRTVQRKIREMVYAWQIEKALTKEQILEAYLNTIYLGYGCYGIDAAAHTYFSKDVENLNLAESAALAALPQAPDSYALIKDEEAEAATYLSDYGVYANDLSKERRNLVLDMMAEQGYISKDDADCSRCGIDQLLRPDMSVSTSEYTYFTDFLAGEVVDDLMTKKGLTKEKAERLLHTGGLHVYSTISAETQRTVNEEFSDDSNFPSCVDGQTSPQASMVITEVGTGQIKAMVGGRNAAGKKLFNRATSPRQPGSSIKPLSVYSAALQKSYECYLEGETFPFVDYGFDKQGTKYWGDYITAGSYVIDEKMIDGNGNQWPQNYSRTYSGTQTFRTALQQSLNTCAVKIERQVGDDYSIEMLRKFGISTLQDDTSNPVNDMNPAALALGAMTYGTTPLDMALAYAAFPGGGIRTSAVCYTKVTDADGDVILEKTPEKEAVMDKGVAWIMTDVLKSVVSKGIAGSANISGTQVGGKTGTTNDAYDIWFCGFTPVYSAALWIGTDENIEMNTTSDTAARLFSVIMSQVAGAADGEYVQQPDNVITYKGEYFTEGTEKGALYEKPSSSGSTDNANDEMDERTEEEFLRDFFGGSYSQDEQETYGIPDDVDAETEEWIRDWMSSN